MDTTAVKEIVHKISCSKLKDANTAENVVKIRNLICFNTNKNFMVGKSFYHQQCQ